MKQEPYEEVVCRQKRRRRVSLPMFFLTASLAFVLGGAITIGLLVGRIGENGLSIIQAMTVIRTSFVESMTGTR